MPSVTSLVPSRKVTRYLFITITLAAAANTHVSAQQITNSAPPFKSQQFPTARPLIAPAAPDSPIIESNTQAYRAGLFTLDGNVVITWKSRRIEADHIEYNSQTRDLALTGHVAVSGGPNDERIQASRGTYNLESATGTFYDVTGSVGVKQSVSSRRTVYTTGNPFRFAGRMLVKTGPQDYDIYDGSVTSCQLPRPDWLLSASHFQIDGDKAHASYSTFRLLNVPIMFLPYVTAPTDLSDRQSGFEIPTIGQSNIKGLVLGEEIYFALNRSADLSVGAMYYSSVGWEQNATFRFQGPRLDHAQIHYSGVLDHRAGTANQGGEEIVLSARHDFTPNTRVATDIDYLSSYIYREAFTDNFNQAVTSDITSRLYGTHTFGGFEISALADRYQGIKTIAQAPTASNPAGIPEQQVRIFHAPALVFDSTDHRIGSTGLEFSLESSADGLKRSQPNFVTSGIVERFDLHPQLAYPITLDQWHIVPSVAARETFYSRSRVTPVPGQAPLESTASISRSDFEFAFNLRPPVIERTFLPPPSLQRFFGTALRHTIEPELTYRLATGIHNFTNILRFDSTDVVSNTHEAEYGVTQRFFRKRINRGPCATAQVAAEPGLSSNPAFDDVLVPPAEASKEPCTVNETLISWRLTQKYFFDPNFGGAIVNGRRNIFDTTLNLSGVAFLTEQRDISPLISRLRVRTSAHTDVEWDFDLDTGAKKFTSSNVYVDVHQGQFFTALSYARLDAPGRFFTQDPTPASGGGTTGTTSQVSDFNQLRYLIGYGNPGKPGLSVAANTGLDLKSLYGTTSNISTPGSTVSTSTTVYPALLQYATVQTSYNFNCCGFSVEYRKYELGSVRNEGTYKFSFTLANIGTAGNLRRAERLF